MTPKQAVITAIKMFSDSYPGKFTVGDNVKTWERVLSDMDPDVIPAAALHLISTRKDWPPDPATLREQCVLMSHGQLHEPTGSEAWEHIRERMAQSAECDEPLKLTDLERRALKQTGTLYDLRRSANPASDRATFIKAFNTLVSKQKLERQTLPEVKALVQKKHDELPEYSQVRALVAGITEGKDLG
jgi:hypothetical protein